MTNRINKNMSSGAASVAEFNRKYTPNTPCFYQPSRNEDKWYPTRTRSEAWMLGHGDVVVKVDGTSGCVSIEHLAMPGSDRYRASTAEAEEARRSHNAEVVQKPKAINVTTFLDELYGDLCHLDASPEVLNIASEYKNLAAELQGAGQFGDGYHTFDELYAHRVRLFSSLMRAYPDKSWWSDTHHDGSAWDGWIIAGIDTPAGTATYHLPVTEVDRFGPIARLERGKEWDGHTAEDVLERLKSL